MNLLWNGIEISVNLVEVGLYLFLINSKFHNKTKSHIPFLLALVIGAVGLWCIAFYHVPWMPDFLFETIVVFLYAIITRKGKILLKLFWVVIGITLICATSIIAISLGLLMPGVTMDVILRQQSAARFQLLILCKLMQALLFFALATRKGHTRLFNIPIIILLILVSSTSFLMVLLLLEYGLGPAPSITSQLLMIGASMSVLVMNLIVFILFESLSRQAENNLQMQARIQQNDMLVRHSEEIAGLYDEMRGWRHDYHNHLQVIHGYLQLKKYDKLEAYLKGIENNITGMEMPINSGNLLVDAIISSKILLASNQNIDTHANIQVPTHLKMSETDMCVLLGNLLDNAIEACQRIIEPEVKRFIEVEIRAIKGHLYITVRNSTSGNVRMLDNIFLSDKNGRHHGVGIRHIDEITGKYEGYISRSHENCVFETTIMFPLEKIIQPVLQTSETECILT